MSANSAVLLKDQRENPTFLVEVINIEKQLWAVIHSKGLSHPDVRDLYHKAGSIYEKLFLSDLKHEELQDVEYSLWKLHYKHIDEFRRRIKINSASSEGKKSVTSSDTLIEEFESFLSRATEFYENLIVKIRRYYGISEECSKPKRVSMSASVEPKEIQRYKFLCHRFFVCLGDLARYMEIYQKMGDDDRNWSVSATHYLEATKTWPDSGNPHNQLAVLATYVGDEFLALYHCVRSLAVKEPFPDAWNNLILLFEKNRSSHLESLSFDALFDFSKPSERSRVQKHFLSHDDTSSCCSSKVEKGFNSGTNSWPLLVRTMSFFFLKSSLDDFPCVLASTMRELDSMLEADDRDLKPMLESYQLMDSAKRGPFRSLQLVSMFIFTFHSLTLTSETKGSVELRHLVLTTAFIIVGSLVERCLKTNPLDSSPILPALLVFVEYLPFLLDGAEECGFDDRSASALSYFFGAFVNLLNKLSIKSENQCSERTALWEDHELRGFAPVSPSHTSLDFSTYWDHRDGIECGRELRVKRIINSAMKISNRLKGSQKWIVCDKLGSEFFRPGSNAAAYRKGSGGMGCIEQILDENGESVAGEEEEVILFKPLTRYNSAPLYSSVNTKEPDSPRNMEDQTVSSDECLRRATSLLIAQNPMHRDASDISNFRFEKAFNQPEAPSKDMVSEGPITAGPPSLRGWVINSDRDKGRCDILKLGLSPIDETTSVSFSSLSITETDNSIASKSSTHEFPHGLYSATSYSPPIPSAPLLPDDDAAWFHGTDKAGNCYGWPQKIGTRDYGLIDCGLPLPDVMSGYPNLPLRGMSSSEWLCRYRENHQNFEPGNYTHAYPPQANPRHFHGHDSSRFGLLDRYGTPTDLKVYTENSHLYPGFPHFYMGDEHRREKFSHGYQRPNPFGFDVMPDLRDDPRPLLQYLKEKEWLVQQNQTLRGPPTFMGN